MKKNFVVKALASTLALAMVATAAPVMPASAAKAPALNQKSKTIYINENDLGSSFDFNVKNKVSGSKYKWTTSNKAIATVDKSGVVTAGTKTGKATITCKITLKNKKTKSLKATVTVKENATKAEISNPVETAKIGEEVNFNKKFTTASGASCTDYQAWEIDEASNTAGATVVASNGKVTATKAGEYKVRVRAYQNKTKLAANDTVDSEWLTVKVAPSVTAVAQSHDNKVAVTFDDNMKDKLKTTDFVIKNKTTNQNMTIQDISYSEDGKIAYVKSYITFTDAANYVVTYKEKDYEFTASVGVPATITATTTQAVVNKETDIKLVVKDANGIDISASTLDKVKLETVDGANAYLDASNKKITIYAKDAVAKLKATYHSGEFTTDGQEKNKIEQEFTITGVDAIAAAYGAVSFTIADSNADVDMTKIATPVTRLAVGDSGKFITVNVKDTANNAVLKNSAFEFKSGNDNVLLVNENGALTPIKDGVVSVLILDKNTHKVVASAEVTVLKERKAASISLSTNSLSLASNVENLVKYVEVTVKDQHGDKINGADFDIETRQTGTPAGLLNKVGGKLVVTPNGIAAGTYKYFIKAVNTLNGAEYKTTLDITLKASDLGAPTNFNPDFSAYTMDAVVNSATDANKNVSIVLAGLRNGQQVSVEDLSTWSVTVKNQYGVDCTSLLDKTTATNFKFNVTKLNDSTVDKAAAGKYTVKFEKGGVSFTRDITVTDTQALPTVTCEKKNITADGDVAMDSSNYANIISKALVIKDCNGVKYGEGGLVTNVTISDDNNNTQKSDKAISIKKVTVTYTVYSGVTATADIDVNQTITCIR